MNTPLIAVAFLFASGAALAQSGDMKGMDMKGMDMKGMDMKGMDMKGMDMKGMDMKGMSKDGMKDMDHKAMSKGGKDGAKHSATGTVKSVDAKAGTVTLDHDPVKSLDWPAMTMTFKVKDKALLKKLQADKKVEVELVKEGKDYVVTSVK